MGIEPSIVNNSLKPYCLIIVSILKFFVYFCKNF